jgi:hypothetical protein
VGRWFSFSRDGGEIAKGERPVDGEVWRDVRLPDADRVVLAAVIAMSDGATGVQMFVDGHPVGDGRSIENWRREFREAPRPDVFEKQWADILNAGLIPPPLWIGAGSAVVMAVAGGTPVWLVALMVSVVFVSLVFSMSLERRLIRRVVKSHLPTAIRHLVGLVGMLA